VPQTWDLGHGRADRSTCDKFNGLSGETWGNKQEAPCQFQVLRGQSVEDGACLFSKYERSANWRTSIPPKSDFVPSSTAAEVSNRD